MPDTEAELLELGGLAGRVPYQYGLALPAAGDSAHELGRSLAATGRAPRVITADDLGPRGSPRPVLPDSHQAGVNQSCSPAADR
jgi:hypothetical protein